MRLSMPMTWNIRSKGMITTTSSLPQGQLGNQRGCKFPLDNLLSFYQLDDYGPNLQRQSDRNVGATALFLWLVCHVLGTDLALEEPPCPPSAITSRLQTTLRDDLFPSDCDLTSTPFADMAMLSEDFNAEKCQGLPISTLMGKSWLSRLLRNCASVSPNARIINAYGPTEATVALSAVAVTDEMLAILKRLPIGYTIEDSPTFIIDEAGNKLPNGEQGDHRIRAQLFQKVIWIIQRKQQKPSSNLKVFQPTIREMSEPWRMKVSFFYGGRMDFQIKFNGYRIELEVFSSKLEQIEVYWLSSRSTAL